MNLEVVDHPGLALRSHTCELPAALGEVESPAWLADLLRPDAATPLAPSDDLKARVRDLLRGHGYKPTGRGKPSAEYLAGAVAAGRLGPINAAVDVGNVVSLHSRLPISVVDLDACTPPLRVDVPPAGSRYVFNRSGQEIDIGGLLSLFDADGPCANAVKDAQRTKTSDATRRVLAVVWGVAEPAGYADEVADWMRELFDRLVEGK